MNFRALEIRSRIRLTDMCCERTARLALRIKFKRINLASACELLIVSCGCQVNGRTALPAAHKSRTEELSAGRVAGEARDRGGYGVGFEEGVEFGHELGQVAEGEEGAVEGPVRTRDGVAFATEQDDALVDGFLAALGCGEDVLDCGLGDAVCEAETIFCQQMMAGGMR
jgi:hypothetical protein